MVTELEGNVEKLAAKVAHSIVTTWWYADEAVLEHEDDGPELKCLEERVAIAIYSVLNGPDWRQIPLDLKESLNCELAAAFGCSLGCTANPSCLRTPRGVICHVSIMCAHHQRAEDNT